MPLTDTGRNGLLTSGAAAITHLALLDATLAEISGGSPAYARQAVSWTAASGGVRDNQATVPFDVPATTIAAAGFRDALSGGNDLGWAPLGAHTALVALAAAGTDTLTSYAHGLANDQRVFAFDLFAGGLPAGLAETALYWIVAATTDTFQLATSQGGAAVNVTGDGELVVQRCSPQTFAAQGLCEIQAGQLDLDLRMV